MSKNSLCLVVAAALAASVLGCGSDDGKSGEGLTGTNKIEACKIVTQEAATDLFTVPAVSEPPDSNPSGLILAQCHWTTDDVDNSQLLQFYVWDGPEGYSTPSDSQPFDIGEKGHIRTVLGTGQNFVEIMWVQDALTVTLDYSCLGSFTPIPATTIDAVKTMALGTSSKLKSD
jgi:hypothetical protein